MSTKTGTQPYRRLTFTVITARPLPVGEQVFISGSDPALGNWAPDGLPLTRIDDAVWSGVAEVNADRAIEFKITRGSWDTEEYRKGPLPPPNRRLPRGGDAALEFRVTKWKN